MRAAPALLVGSRVPPPFLGIADFLAILAAADSVVTVDFVSRSLVYLALPYRILSRYAFFAYVDSCAPRVPRDELV